MLAQLGPALRLFFALTLITGVLYPLTVTGIAQVLFPRAAHGSLLLRGDEVVGSTLLGQSFTDSTHFWGRRSATARVPYDGAASSGSNLGPTHPALLESIEGRVAALRALDPGDSAEVPVDLVTASGSGLDPHITPAAAEYQVARVARARGMEVSQVQRLVAAHTEPRTFQILGEPRVNVLTLNLALETQVGSR